MPNQQQTIAGLRPVQEALDADLRIDRVYIQKGLSSPLANNLLGSLREQGVPFQFVPVEKLNKLAPGNHQGIVATVSPIRYHNFLELLPSLQEQGIAPFVLLLDHVTDVRNMGAIVRSAECGGVHAVCVPDHGTAQIGPDAVKSSSGALLRMPVCCDNPKTIVNFAKQCGLQVVAATEKGSTVYTDIDFSQPTLLMLGAEDTGLSPDLLRLADAKASLPVMGKVQSLNVSAAAAVFIYETLRQRGISI